MRCIECEGAPRDLGRDQGEALADAIRSAIGGNGIPARLRALRRDAPTRRLGRDLRRYFPHQSEWLEGMARAARVPEASLVRALAASAGPDAAPALAAGAVREAAVRVVCPVPARAVMRRVRPEGRFASIELALPTATAPLAGVNEAGLAVVALSRGWRPGRFAPPMSLFARDCLERFERVDPALEWCLSRPAAEGGMLLVADAKGELLGVDALAPRRRVVAASEGWLTLGVPGAMPPAWLKRGEPADGDAVEAGLVTALASAAPTGDAALVLDPGGRRLRVAGEAWSPAPGGDAP